MGLNETRDPNTRRLLRQLWNMLLTTLRMAGYEPQVTYHLLLNPTAHFNPGTFSGTGPKGPRVKVHAQAPPAGAPCVGGDQATDQAPKACRPNAAQSVVPRGLRVHTRETASLSSRGGWRTVPEVGPALRLAPQSAPLGGCGNVWGAMMLSRTGRDRDPPLGCGQTGEGRRAPWGCAVGAPTGARISSSSFSCVVWWCEVLSSVVI